MALDTAPILLRKRNIAFKLETTNGQKMTLAAADGVTQCFTDGDEGVITDDIESVEREGQGSISAIRQEYGAEAATAKFKHEIYNSGSSTPPKWTDLLLACGMSNTANVFTPVTGATRTITIGHFLPGRALYDVGAMGTWTLTATRAKPVMIAYSFPGVWSPPKADTISTPTYDTPIDLPKAAATLTIANVGTFRIPEVVIEYGNEIVMREDVTATNADGDLIGYRCAYIVDRKTRIRVSPEALPLTTQDWYAIKRARTTSTFTLAIGSGTNKVVTFAAPKLQLLSNPKVESRNKFMAEALEFGPIRNTDTGDDDLLITLS